MSALAIWRELEAGGWATLERWRDEKREEDLHCDFKAASWVGNDVGPKDVSNLAKGISAFANIEGGVLLFGIRTDREGRGSPDRVATLEGVADVDRFKNRLDDLRASVTVPEVPGVRMKTIRDPADGTRGVVAVLIPYNELGPFRASKGEHANIYFQRSSTTAEPMPHQVLSAMFARVAVPRLRLGVRCGDGDFQLVLQNSGRGHAEHLSVYLRDVGAQRWGQKWKAQASNDGRAHGTRDGVLLQEQIDWVIVLQNFGIYDIDATVYAAGCAPLRVNTKVDARQLGPNTIAWIDQEEDESE